MNSGRVITTSKQQQRSEPLRRGGAVTARYQMRLFVAGEEANSLQAKKNIQDICAEHIPEEYDLKIIDVFEDFTATIEENILLTPALVIDKPKKMKIFGSLQDKTKVLAALGLT